MNVQLVAIGSNHIFYSLLSDQYLIIETLVTYTDTTTPPDQSSSVSVIVAVVVILTIIIMTVTSILIVMVYIVIRRKQRKKVCFLHSIQCIITINITYSPIDCLIAGNPSNDC